MELLLKQVSDCLTTIQGNIALQIFGNTIKRFLQKLKLETKFFLHFGQFQVYLGDITLTAFLNTFSSVDFYGIKSLCKPRESNVYITDAYGSAKSVHYMQVFAM